MLDRRPLPADPAEDRLAILYEHDAWLEDFFAALDAADVPYAPVRMDDAAVWLDEPPAYPLIFNRVSPSSYLRGHGPAIAYARSFLEAMAGGRRRVVNGPDAFRMETSKSGQLLLLRSLGVAAPRTILFNGSRRVAEAARDFPFPAILKPDCGGSGAFVRRVADHAQLRELVAEEGHLFGPDHLLLLQQEFPGGQIVRTEFIDGELVYAMRVTATNTYNLCPAPGCERTAADPDRPEAPSVRFEPFPQIAPDAVAQAREIVRAAGLDVGGVEYVQTPEGRLFFDINATSVYRRDVADALGVDAWSKLVAFLDRERRKELAKRPAALRIDPAAGHAGGGTASQAAAR